MRSHRSGPDPFRGRVAGDERPHAGVAAPSPSVLIRWALWRQRWTIARGATAGIVWMGTQALVPVLFGQAIDEGIAAGSAASTVRWSAAVGAIVVISAAAGVVRHYHAVLLFNRTRWLFEQLLARRALDPGRGDLPAAGDLLARAQNDARAVGSIADLMCRGSGAVVTFVAVGIGMIAASPLLGSIVLVGLPPCLLMLVPLWKPYDRRATEQQRSLAGATTAAADSLEGLRVVKGLGGESTVDRWFGAASSDVRRQGIAVATLAGLWAAVSSVMPALFLAVVLYVGGNLAIDGELDPGDLVSFAGLATFLVLPVLTLAEVGDVWARGVAGARRIAEVLVAPPEAERQVPAPFDPFPAGLTGVVCADPLTASALADRLAARHVTSSGRQPWLFDGNVAANVTLDPGGPEQAGGRAGDALRAAAAFDVPPGAVGDGGRRLSGGQRQRVALARALASGADPLVLHEPTTALDTVTEAAVVEGIRAHRQGRDTLVITTSPSVLDRCDSVVFLTDAGARRATHAELLEHTGYRTLVLADES